MDRSSDGTEELRSFDAGRALSLDDFDYDLPAHRIAHAPSAKRDGSKLCFRDPGGTLSDFRFSQLPQLLPVRSHLVMNDTAVFPARLQGRLPCGREVDVLLLQPPVVGSWIPFMGKPSKHLRKASHIIFAAGKQAEVRWSDASGGVFQMLWQEGSDEKLQHWLQLHGQAPLPPYIPRSPTAEDRSRYQTLYAAAQHSRSVAAPTAGLHISEEVLWGLAKRDITLHKVRLHIGRGTFQPVKSQRPQDHVMHRECYEVPHATWQALCEARKRREPIILVGTTTLRALESLGEAARRDAAQALKLTDQPLSTDLFIYPEHCGQRYKPWMGDGLITNFHAPRSTLFMLICALIGIEEAHKLYRYALQQNYRFLSYGDSTLLMW